MMHTFFQTMIDKRYRLVAAGLLMILATTLAALWLAEPIALFLTGAGWLSWAAMTYLKWKQPPGTVTAKRSATAKSRPVEVQSSDSEVDHPDDLFRLMLSQDRAALLLRSQVAQNLSATQIAVARAALDEAMALVPDGRVLLKQPSEEASRRDDFAGATLQVEALLLDRHPVTNRQYLEFVNAGGYSQSALWDREMLAGVLDFVDLTGQPGPKFWQHGQPPVGLEDHPVVGVCWYEAAAYARWVGKRLPSDAEWVKAGSWPMPVPGGEPVQRKFPWGNSWAADRANTWGSGPGETTPVSEYETGASVSGVYGLVGNVWEWTTDYFGAWHGPGDSELLSLGMRSLRGGAFDTYFEKQATCHFQSGDLPLARKHNIGFRCAVGVCDLVSDIALAPTEKVTETPLVAELEEAAT